MTVPSDSTRLWFVRLRETGATVGLFWTNWSGITLLLPREIDPGACEVAELPMMAGVLFPDAPKLHEAATAGWADHRIRLSEGVAELLFDNGASGMDDLRFEPLYAPPDLAALAAGLSDDELLGQWREIEGFGSASPSPEERAIRAEVERRGLFWT